MKKQKLPSVILASVIILALIISGCGPTQTPQQGTDTPPANEPNTPAQNEPAPPVDDGKTEILVGYVAPFTGPLADFAQSTEWVEEKIIGAVNADGGVYVESLGKKLPIRIIYGDSKSDAVTASEVADKLVLNDKVDVLIGAWAPPTALPVSAICERRQVPGLISNSPVDAWMAAGPYEWSTSLLFDYDKASFDFIAMWDKLDTNKKVGFVYDNEVDGVQIATRMTELLPDRGYTIVDPGRFPSGTNDYTSIISKFALEGVDIIAGDMVTPDFAIFWKQLQQSGFMPKVISVGRAYAYNYNLEALGDSENLSTIALWDRAFPFKSVVTGQSCEEMASMWEAEKNSQAPMSLGYDVTCFEALIDALSRTKSFSTSDLRDALRSVKMDSFYGPIEVNSDGYAVMPSVCVQWVADPKWSFKTNIVSAESYPIIPTVDPVLID